jgi:uncharacterized protein (DUF2141 family)
MLLIRKKTIIVTVICLFVFASAAQSQNSVSVNITNLKNDEGVCKVCLFNNEQSFAGKGEPLLCVDVNIINRAAATVFKKITAGMYAIAVFHDVNRNNKLDVNFLGIPTEAYGASLNKLPFAAAPRFNDNQFAITDSNTVYLYLSVA